MTTQPLPERPNLEQLKHRAKDLLRSAQAKDPRALARFRALPSLAARTDDEMVRTALALHDAQSVVAREYGFASWNALRDRVEELTLQFAEAVTEFVRAATDGRRARAERLLVLHPGIAHASLHTALVLGDAPAVEARLAVRPALANERGGPRDWEPLLYLCHTSLPRDTVKDEGRVAIAHRLLALGADPNGRYPWLHHGVRRAVLWGATCVTGLLPLAERLLQSGAKPNDGVTLTLAAGGGNLPVLELLLRYGADVNFPWATDGTPPVYSILGWAKTAVGVRWLLEHGADPKIACGRDQETALHVAARKWDVAMAELLVAHGAEIAPRRADGRTPHALAELNGNRAVAEWLLAHGSPDVLSEVDRLAAACSRGDGATAKAMLAGRPELGVALTTEHPDILRQAAERGDGRAIETMLACGFDVNGVNDMGATALHCAAHAGWPEVTKVLLAHGASVAIRDREFHAQPLVWAAEGARSSGEKGRDHAAVGRLLLDAGSPIGWESGEEPAEALLEVLAEWGRG